MEENQEKPKGVRRADRLQHELLVAYHKVDGFRAKQVGPSPTDWAVNISKGGIFINTRNPLPVGTTIRLIISLPDTPSPFDVIGRVARVQEFDNPSNQVPGMAIEFMDVDEESKARIDRFVERLRKELPDELTPAAPAKK